MPEQNADKQADNPEEELDEQSEQPRSLRDRVILVAAVGILVAFIGLMAYSLYTPSTSNLGEGGRVNATGSQVYLGDRQAPDFTLDQFDGGDVSLSDYQGQWVVINFWASWCPPCRDEAPMLSEFNEDIQGEDIVLLGIAIWDQEDEASAFLNQYDLVFPNASDSQGSVAIEYGVYGVPETYFIGPDGVLYGKYRGPLESADHIHELLDEFSPDNVS